MWDVNLDDHEDDLGRADVVAILQRMFFTRVTIRIINKHRQRIAKQMLAVKQTPAAVSSFSSSLASSCASSPFTSSSYTPSSYTPSSCTPSSSFSSSSSHYASGASSPTSYTSNDFLDEILEATVLHPRNIRFPVARDYQLLFLDFVESLMTRDHVTTDQKVKLQQLKDSLKETDETGHHEHGHGRRGRNGGHSYKTYIHPQSLHPITLLESATYVDEAFGTTGLASTTASFILSDWIRLHPEFFRGKNVLELGCGCGLAGITTVAACQPETYTFTDYHAKVRQVDVK